MSSVFIHGQNSSRNDLEKPRPRFRTSPPNARLWNRVVERFKLRLRDSLEKRIKQKGGVTHAIIREAFLNWDADASGKLDPEELVRTLYRLPQLFIML